MRVASSSQWRRVGPLAGVVVGLLAAAPQALADPPWSAPQTITGAYEARWEPIQGGGLSGSALNTVDGLLAFTPGGAGAAVLGRDAGGRGFTRFNGAQGSFGALTASTFAGIAPSRIAPFGRTGVVLAGQANAKGDPSSPLNPAILLNAAVTRGSSASGFSARQVLAKGVLAGCAAPAVVTALATNGSGDTAVVVSVPVTGRTRVAGYRSRLFIRGRGQSTFRRIMDFGRTTVGRSPAALAINNPGDVLVTWDDRVSVRARMITSSGKIGHEQRLGQGGSAVFGDRLVAAMDGTRRMLVAWMAQRVGEGDYAGSPGIVALAYASPYSAFRPAQVVQRDLPKGSGRAIRGPAVRAALLRDRGVVVWTGYANGRYVVRTVDVTSGRASTPTDLSPAGTDASLQGLAVGPRGGTIAAWSSRTRNGSAPLPSPPPGLYAISRAADAAAWGAVETVTTTGSPGDLPTDAAIAANPVSGQTVLLWSDPLQAMPSVVPVRYSVRSLPY